VAGLNHGCDPRASHQHADASLVLVKRRLNFDIAINVFKVDCLSGLNLVHVTRHVRLLSVVLDEQIKVTHVGVGTDGRVGTHNLFSVNLGFRQDAGAGTQLQGFGRIRRGKTHDRRGAGDGKAFQKGDGGPVWAKLAFAGLGEGRYRWAVHGRREGRHDGMGALLLLVAGQVRKDAARKKLAKHQEEIRYERRKSHKVSNFGMFRLETTL